MGERPGEMDERDVDERFASIVAAWDGPVPSPDVTLTRTGEPAATPEPDPADDPTGAAAPERAARPDTDPAAGPRGPGWVDPAPLDLVVPVTWRGATSPAPDEEEDEHFEPPEVTLPPQEDLHFWGAVVGLVVGPLILVWVAMVRPFYSTRWFLAGVALSLAGFALLVLRQPRHRDPEDDDDGARL